MQVRLLVSCSCAWVVAAADGFSPLETPLECSVANRTFALLFANRTLPFDPFPDALRTRHPCCNGVGGGTGPYCCLDWSRACAGFANISSCPAGFVAKRLAPAAISTGETSPPLIEADIAHIVLAVEGTFFAGTFAAIASAVDQSATPRRLHFHVFADCRSFVKLEREASRFWCGYSARGATLSLYQLDASLFDLASHGCPHHCIRGVFAEQLRLYLPDLLPKVDKALWVDADSLVLGDAAALLRGTFIGVHANRSMAGVIRAKTIGRMMGLTNASVPLLLQLQLAGVARLPSFGPSMNGGLMALNLRRWRANNLTGRIRDLIPRLQRVKLGRFSGMNTASDAQTPLLLLCLNSTPFDIEPLPMSWNVEGLGWKRIAEVKLCAGNFLHWSGKHKPWNERQDRYVRYADIWRPYGMRVKAAQARSDAQGLLADSTCAGLRIVHEPSQCVEQRIAAIDGLADELIDTKSLLRSTGKRTMTMQTRLRGVALGISNIRAELIASRKQQAEMQANVKLKLASLTAEQVKMKQLQQSMQQLLASLSAGLSWHTPSSR